MNTILKGRWFIPFAWLVVIIGLFFLAPNIADLVREKGQLSIPNNYSSAQARNIIKEIQKQKNIGDQSTVALVFQDDKKLTNKEIAEAKKALHKLEGDKKQLGITEIHSHFIDENLKDQLFSKDGKTILVLLSFSWNDRDRDEVSDALYAAIKGYDVEHYYTSNWMINRDITKGFQEGLKKTEGITVIFILAVLLIIFRSIIAPLIPLITVGVSYLASQSIVAILVDKCNFPISNYTQIFLVAVLFGIGTDYCILLLSRFKEEFSHRESIVEAILETYKTAGRTVFFSSMAVMIGFAAIGFSKFKLYQSASAVAVGVALLLIALFTLVPFFMFVLGPNIFWPSKSSTKHEDSKIWAITGKFSLTRPLLTLLIVAVICVPFLMTYDGKLSFNSLDEISDKVSSINAFNAIADSFGPGKSNPSTIVIKNDEKMDSIEYIGLAENLNKELAKLEHVDKVRSVTHPTGEPIEKLYVGTQAQSLEEGLEKGKQGLDKISNGLHYSGSELSKFEPKLTNTSKGINDLISGTSGIQSGLTEIQTNLMKIEDGIRQGSAKSEQIIQVLEDAKTGAEKLLATHQNLQPGYEEIDTNLFNIITQNQKIGAKLEELSGDINQIPSESFGYLEQKYNGLDEEQAYQVIKNALLTTQPQLPQVVQGITGLNTSLSQLQNQLQTGIKQGNSIYAEVVKNQALLGTGLEQLIEGIEAQQKGLNQLADGQGKIVSIMPKLTNGLSSINDGQKQLLNGFSNIDGQIKQLSDGLNQSVEGLDKVSGGIGSATNYLSGLSQHNKDSFYIPQEVLESNDFAESINTYMSKDRKIMTLDVIFAANPYSNEAINQVDELKDAVSRVTKGTKLENAEVAIGGITSTNADLRTISHEDYSRTVVFMLLGISVILVFLFRSIIMPAYIIGSLILSFYTAMGINEAIYVKLLGYSGISWVVPFFGFVILVALGVDYSIFLMDRFNEYRGLSVAEAMLEAMKKMGTVIISAAIILGGTFGAMMPSGMLSLLQIASIVLAGLALYAFVILPLFIPVMVKNFGEANWWPYKRPN
ncbi:MMPL family transporter [Niallia sp. 01092]|uniref:MMPL family transporter n=1 Tax=unclassified Niallia TaxID=2837522 RepID=UPI003FCF1A0F